MKLTSLTCAKSRPVSVFLFTLVLRLAFDAPVWAADTTSGSQIQSTYEQASQALERIRSQQLDAARTADEAYAKRATAEAEQVKAQREYEKAQRALDAANNARELLRNNEDLQARQDAAEHTDEAERQLEQARSSGKRVLGKEA